MADPTSIHWTTIGAFWASLSIALITVMATVINYLFFRANVDPNIIIYVDTDEKRPSLILLVVENIGKGLARDISFNFSKPLPQDAWGLGPESEEPQAMNSGPLIHGIPALAGC